MNRLQPLIQSLGRFGPAGLAVLVLCALFYVVAVMPAEASLAAQRSAGLQRAPGAPDGVQSSASRGAALRTFQSLFPSTDSLPLVLEKLWAGAAAARLDLPHGEYRFEAGAPGLVRYRITLPLRASYAQLRAFINFILTEIPTASIDGLRFERKDIGDTLLDARIELTLYFRTAGTLAAPS